MGIGITEAAALLWLAFDEDEYNAFFLYEENGVYYFSMLPDWAHNPRTDDGPFNYNEDTGELYNTSLRPSQDGYYIGNVTFD